MLPVPLRRYADALVNGFQDLLPPFRLRNKAFLLTVLDCMEQEKGLTVLDHGHFSRIRAMADCVTFPPIQDVKSYAMAEVYLNQTCPQYSKKQIRLSLEWAFLLLARHGHVQADLETIRPWLLVWRMVQRFHPLEQGFLSDFIAWLSCLGFSPKSIGSSLREYQKFKAWMVSQDIGSLGAIRNIELQRYLLYRACGQQNGSKQKILGNLRAVFYYYKWRIDGGFTIPDYTVKAPRPLGVNVSASHQQISQLWEAIEAENLPAMAGLMLALVMGYGLPLKVLSLLRLTDTPGRLAYTDRLPSRQGVREHAVLMNLQAPWLASLWRESLFQRNVSPDCPYLFTSGHGQRRKRPVSVEYCQKKVQEAVTRVLGYPIPVNHLERGAMKGLALEKPLSEFMSLTDQVPKTRLTRMMTWLCQH